jgi:hypothetical protein
MAENVEKTISNLIEKDFPAYYREEGPVFVEFVKSYYKWMEQSNNITYHARRLMEYGDVDETIDDFIVYFKEKYLKGIQFETQTNTRQLIKHTLDLYRSKGTERSIALLFALVFGESAEVYYPGEDIFRLSDGSWVRPKYLEVTSRADNVDFVGKQITGLNSGATAFVERLIRRKIYSKYIEVFYISAINGDFETNEKVIYEDANIKTAPFIIGSMTTLDIINTGTDFEIGDIVSISSNNGVQGKGRVANVSSLTGLADFELVEGGWGYSADADVLVSEKVITLSNVAVTAYSANTNYPLTPFQIFEPITQPMCSIQYEYANGTFYVGNTIVEYYGNGSVAGTGTVLTVSSTNSTAGTLTIKINSGNLAVNTVFYTSGVGSVDTFLDELDAAITDESNDPLTVDLLGGVTANMVSSGFTDLTATANLMAWSSNVDVNIYNKNGTFSSGEVVVQTGLGNVVIAEATVNTFVTTVGSNGTLLLTSTNGVFKTGKTVYGLTSGANAIVQDFTISVGVIDIGLNDFVSTTNNYVYTTNSATSGTITRISSGTGATFGISNTLLNAETVRINTDYVRDFADVELDATAYGFTGNVVANASTILLDALTLANVVIGEISSILSENPGVNYDTAPFVTIYEPTVAPSFRHDYIFKITGASSSFYEGEVITQDVTGAQAIVLSGSNTSLLYLKRIGYNNTFNNTDIIVGDFSTASATVTEIGYDYLSLQIGLNANVTANVISGNGVVTSLEVYDSGFGYIQDELATFTSADGLRSGSVRVNLQKQGVSEGYYRNKGGFLSDNKYLHDGEYYQEYSYEVRSSVTLDKYSDMLKQIIHVAGTKFFGGYVKKSLANVEISLSSTSITIES